MPISTLCNACEVHPELPSCLCHVSLPLMVLKGDHPSTTSCNSCSASILICSSTRLCQAAVSHLQGPSGAFCPCPCRFALGIFKWPSTGAVTSFRDTIAAGCAAWWQLQSFCAVVCGASYISQRCCLIWYLIQLTLRCSSQMTHVQSSLLSKGYLHVTRSKL